VSEQGTGARAGAVRSRIVARSRGPLTGLEPLIPSRFAPRADGLPLAGSAGGDAGLSADDGLAPGEPSGPGPRRGPAGLDRGGGPAARGGPATGGARSDLGPAAGDHGWPAPHTPGPPAGASLGAGPRPPAPAPVPAEVTATAVPLAAGVDREGDTAGLAPARPGEPWPAAGAAVTAPGPVIISIGHIEVSAAADPRARPAAERPGPARPRPAFRPRVTLTDFLDGDAGRP
jgi:hypothetical protein